MAALGALEIEEKDQDFDYSQRANWLRAAVLGANDGLVSTASLMMGVGAVKQDVRLMILTGFAGLIAGACSMAIGEFVSVYSQLDIEVAQMKRDSMNSHVEGQGMMINGGNEEKDNLPSPIQAALASALSFAVGAMMPLLAAAFIKEYKVRLGVVAGVASLMLLVFGGVGAVLGKAPVGRSCFRVLLGGLLAMAITFGLTKLIATVGSDKHDWYLGMPFCGHWLNDLGRLLVLADETTLFVKRNRITNNSRTTRRPRPTKRGSPSSDDYFANVTYYFYMMLRVQV
ncbi:hypothetical protein Scep_018772 [Stephania cephalantha]|uniref:Vacuolar iron transporter n=1 Tax=Stephania cephalantha TaxID=152367 RepID=A0AAP0I9N6_9MAGN